MSTSLGMGIYSSDEPHISITVNFSVKFRPTDPHQALVFSDKIPKHSLLGFQHTAHMYTSSRDQWLYW